HLVRSRGLGYWFMREGGGGPSGGGGTGAGGGSMGVPTGPSPEPPPPQLRAMPIANSRAGQRPFIRDPPGDTAPTIRPEKMKRPARLGQAPAAGRRSGVAAGLDPLKIRRHANPTRYPSRYTRHRRRGRRRGPHRPG
ncbi:MAG: hypothetical protein F4Y33_12420, partial [Gemmatimonadales bacterium]|nr:hypothetical protein [Gemmatimonadales bacterium]